MDNQAPKVVAYLRVSQEDEDINNQLYAIKQYCERKGYELTAVFKDVGVSGATETKERDGFKAMLKFCEDNNIKTIVFYDISRMSRNLIDGLKTLKDLTEQGYDIKFVTQEFLEYIEDPMLKKKVIMDFLWFAELYIEDIKKRTKLALERRKKEGKPLGRPLKLKKDQVELLKELYKKKVSISSIAKILGISRSTVYEYINKLGLPKRK